MTPRRPALLCGLLLLGPALAAAQRVDASVGVVGDEREYGVSQTDRRPALQFGASAYGAGGWFAGAALFAFRPAGEPGWAGQWTAQAGYAWQPAAGWSAQLAAARHHDWGAVYPSRDDRDDFSATLAWRDAVVVSVAALPRRGEEHRATVRSYDLVTRLPVASGVAVSAGLGYYDARRALGTGYRYGNLGLGWQGGSLQLELDYMLASGAARARFGDAAADGWVASLAWNF